MLNAKHGEARRLCVLAVDNYPDSADSLAALLRIWGHYCDVAYNGPTAVEAAEDRTYDVIIAEPSLPGCSGLDLAEQVRRQRGGRPTLIALTGLSLPENREHAAGSGYDFFLVKPTDLEALRDLLDSVGRARCVSSPRKVQPDTSREVDVDLSEPSHLATTF